MTATDESDRKLEATFRDEGLRCPSCGYNLTGLTGSVCPECGVSFDADYLRAVLDGSAPNQPIPGWDEDTSTGLLMRIVRISCCVWLRPLKFARAFPASPSNRSSLRFSLACFAFASAAFILAGLLTARLLTHLAIWLFTCTWTLLYGEFLAPFLTDGVPLRRRLGKSALRYWRCLFRFTSFHVVLASLSALLIAVIDRVYAYHFYDLLFVTILIATGLVLNYALNLTALIYSGIASRRYAIMFVLLFVPAMALLTAPAIGACIAIFAGILGQLIKFFAGMT